MVHRFHEAGLTAGGRDNGAPGERDYHPGYYAAYLLDPDGNNIEAVHHGASKRLGGRRGGNGGDVRSNGAGVSEATRDLKREDGPILLIQGSSVAALGEKLRPVQTILSTVEFGARKAGALKLLPPH